VTKDFKEDDRVVGITHGSNKSNLNDGAYAKYIAVKGDLQIKISDNLKGEEAASLSVGISTVVSAQGPSAPDVV
jgi:NADPH:quinone reductase-like Zn-dependent oxidoreductase